jgi:hypothetical protein
VGVQLVAARVLVTGLRKHERRVRPREADKVDARVDLGAGLAREVTIAGYTLVASEGLDYADPLPYLFLVAAVSAVPITAR